MSDHDALLRAILSAPDEDTPRLAYADEIQDRDPDRAKYIRLAVGRFERDRITETLSEETQAERELLAAPHASGVANARAWAAPVWGLSDLSYLMYHRGFVCQIAIDTAAFLKHAEAIFRAHPVTAVALVDKQPEDLGYGWGWFEDPHDASESSIPSELWHDNKGEDDCMRWVRANPQDCLRALNLRCVAFGRKLAGLPPLRKAVPA